MVLALGVSITSCTKEETVQPKQTDLNSIFKSNDWIYVVSEEWKFLDDTKIQSIHLSTKKVRTHSYVLIGTEFKLTTNYSGVVETTVYPNLSYQNDTVYWNYNQQTTKSVLLVKK